ncbi:choline-sulfatase [Marinobacterium rhizophilum]|uniref:Choline-sulfatase n=1 Tax=Marinobacterium rhizophilum TaxID=420402 RepID=A0ABY5HCT7_9GAMM|nr:choline-sulfatase [Marinobacterium rhizophilum]UTW10090.1 choline-sulfatase [Marinobacterium rhizophilum]
MTTQPNIVFIMADQVAAPALPIYGHRVVKTPNISALAEESTVFNRAYCNFPLCAPARYAMLAGQLCSKIGAYDNAAEFKSSIPTFVHGLRGAGYQTSLVGKMHFVGADQLHGYEERLTTEIYPADFSWIPDWQQQDTKLAFQDMSNVISAAPAARTMQLDFDELVAYKANQKIYDLARSKDTRPFFLTVSFTHPHDPYTPTPEFWDLYDDNEIDAPGAPFVPLEERDRHSQDLYFHYGMDRRLPTEQETLRARHGYYASISYIDHKVGQLIDTLKKTGQWDNTVLIFTSDHGDMMGERGMWYKKSFYEWSLRVPLLIRTPSSSQPARVSNSVSHLDLFPTLMEMAGAGDCSGLTLDGTSLVPYLENSEPQSAPLPRAEYLAEGTDRPQVALVRDPYKLVLGAGAPPLLFNLDEDPLEQRNLAMCADHADCLQSLLDVAAPQWDLESLRQDIIQDQNARRLIHGALKQGEQQSWDYEPRQDASKQFVRGGDWCADAESNAYLACDRT